MPIAPIAREDLAGVLASQHGNEALRAAFESACAEPKALLNVLARYIQFNSAFGPGLANLAGEIAARQGLFRDPGEQVRLLADRAADVASDFFHAAVDEFDRPDPDTGIKFTWAFDAVRAGEAILAVGGGSADRTAEVQA